MALEEFAKKVLERTKEIQENKTFNELISLYETKTMEQCLSKITFLLGCLNFGEDERYRFEDAKAKSNKNKKLDDQVREISNKTKRVLDELLKNLVEQNELISKI